MTSSRPYNFENFRNKNKNYTKTWTKYKLKLFFEKLNKI